MAAIAALEKARVSASRYRDASAASAGAFPANCGLLPGAQNGRFACLHRLFPM